MTVGRVQASDNDEMGMGAVVYSMNDHTDIFEVELDSGVIRTKRRLDREENSYYEVTATAKLKQTQEVD